MKKYTLVIRVKKGSYGTLIGFPDKPGQYHLHDAIETEALVLCIGMGNYTELTEGQKHFLSRDPNVISYTVCGLDWEDGFIRDITIKSGGKVRS